MSSLAGLADAVPIAESGSALHLPDRASPEARKGVVGPASRILYLDGWRGLAIITVLIGHFGFVYWQPLSVLGGFGVDLFFVLSGRLMADILFVSCQPLPSFFRRRFTRIFPALLVFATLMAAASMLVYFARGLVVMQPWEYFSALTFTINYVQLFNGMESRLLDHIWSLSIEEHCYIMLALLALLLRRRIGPAKWVLAGIGVLGLLNGIYLSLTEGGGVHAVYWRTDVRLAPAFLSAAMFLWLQSAHPVRPALARVLGMLPLPCIAISGLLYFVAPVPVMQTASAMLLTIALNGLSFASPWLLHAFSARIFTTFGLLSYSVYLWQQPVYKLTNLVSGLILVPAAIGLGVLSYYTIERPSRRWLNSLRFQTGTAASGRAHGI